MSEVINNKLLPVLQQNHPKLSIIIQKRSFGEKFYDQNAIPASTRAQNCAAHIAWPSTMS
jgi:hypothetical protein